MKQKSERLGKDPVSRLLVKLVLPTTAGMIVMSLNHLVDAIYIDRGVGIIGLAAVSIAFPVQMLILALAGAIGMGGAALISISLGAKNPDKANRILGNMVSMVIILGIISALIAFTQLQPLLRFFGASSAVLPYAGEYLGIVLCGTIFTAFGFVANTVIRAEGNAKTAMALNILASILNLILTPVFIFGFDLGMQGAASGLVLAQIIAATCSFLYFTSGKSSLAFRLAYLKPQWTYIRQTLAIGASAFIRMASSSVMLIVANRLLIFYGGDMAVAVLGIIMRVSMFASMPIMGIVHGMLPLVGYNHGAGETRRVSESILLGAKVATAAAVTAFLVAMLIPRQILTIFTGNLTVIEMGQGAMRIVFALFFTIGVQMLISDVFQALGNARAAFILSLSRQFFLIPSLCLLPLLLNLPGIWLAFPLADLLSFILTLWYIKKYEAIFLKARTPVLTAPKA